MSLIQDIVRSYLPTQKLGHNGWFSFNCPMCLHNGQPRADTRKRGGMQFPDDTSIRYSCFNCGYKTGWRLGTPLTSRFRKLLQGIGMPEAELQRLIIAVLKENEEHTLLSAVPVKRETYVPNWKYTSLPANTRPLVDCLTDPRALNVAQYLHSRSLLELADWMWSDSEDFELYNRAILPLTYKGEIKGWHARYAGDVPDKKTRKIVKKHDSDYIYGLDAQTADRKYVIVTEGEYDALSISGISVGTNRVSQNQADVINALHKEVIVIPDRDRAGRDLEEAAISYGWSVSHPVWDKSIKDTAKAVEVYGQLFVLKNIIEHKESNKIKLKMTGKNYYE